MVDTAWRIPARIDTERVTVRRYVETDAEALHEVTTANIEFLRPWMWWIRDEPQLVEDRIAMIRYFSGQFDGGEGFTMGMFASDGTYLGGTGFNVEDGELEIGYWIRADAQGAGLVTEVTAALARVALEFAGAPRVSLAIEPVNVRSRAIAERLGFSRRSSRMEPFGPGGDPRLSDVYELTQSALADSHAGSFPRPTLRESNGAVVPWPK